MTFDTIRCIFGPLPLSLCTVITVLKGVIFLNICQITMVLTSVKAAFIFFFKSIPTLDDNLVSVYMYMTVNVLSFTVASFRMISLKTPLFHQVRFFRLRTVFSRK